MLSNEEIMSSARTVFELEAAALNDLKNKVNDSFALLVNEIFNLSGRVVVTGIGKSAIIAQKIVATFNSTGTPAVYMHAADAIHGDLGIIQPADLVICLSKSGETPEIKALIPLLKRNGNKLVGLTGNIQSTLALKSDYVLDTTVEKEACPNNLAPTTSTIAQMAVGDALAVCLLKCRRFNPADFAKFHPGGALGKKLYLTLGDLLTGLKPSVPLSASIKDIISSISAGRSGAVAVLDKDQIAGIITDGDLRRMLEKHNSFDNLIAADIMNARPLIMDAATLASEALETFREMKISQLPVTEAGTYLGMVHIHDLNREGII